MKHRSKHRRRVSQRAHRMGAALSMVAALAASSMLVWHASSSAFSATTSNASNSWTAGSVALSDNDAGAALFSVSNMTPGSTGTKCIVVTSTNSIAASVKLYASGLGGSTALQGQITLAISLGSGTNTTCSDFASDGSATLSETLSVFGARAAYGNGLGTWTPAAGTTTKTYKIVYTLSTAAPNSVQGTSAAVNFVWESQNT